MACGLSTPAEGQRSITHLHPHLRSAHVPTPPAMAFITLPKLSHGSSNTAGGWLPHATQHRWRPPAVSSGSNSISFVADTGRPRTSRATAAIMSMLTEPGAANVASSSSSSDRNPSPGVGGLGAKASTQPAAARTKRAKGSSSFSKRGAAGGPRTGRALSRDGRASFRTKLALDKIDAVRKDDWRRVLVELDKAELAEGRATTNNAKAPAAAVSTFVYSKCISRMAKCFRWGEALDILARMAELGAMPNS